MDRPAPRYRPSVLLIIAFVLAVVALTFAVIDRNWWQAVLGAVLLILVAFSYDGARRRHSKI